MQVFYQNNSIYFHQSVCKERTGRIAWLAPCLAARPWQTNRIPLFVVHFSIYGIFLLVLRNGPPLRKVSIQGFLGPFTDMASGTIPCRSCFLVYLLATSCFTCFSLPSVRPLRYAMATFFSLSDSFEHNLLISRSSLAIKFIMTTSSIQHVRKRKEPKEKELMDI